MAPIIDIFKTAFGTQFRYMPIVGDAVLKGSVGTYNDVQWLSSSQITARSALGTPIISPCATGETEYIKNDIKYDVPAFRFPPVTMIEFSQSKEIVKTKVSGRDGTIKEYISKGDWSILIKGILINDAAPNEYPSDAVTALNRLKDAPCSLPFFNRLAQYLNIHQIVIDDIQFPATEAYPGVQAFVINASSDDPFELKELNNFPDNF